jgi:hypothetical protein
MHYSIKNLLFFPQTLKFMHSGAIYRARARERQISLGMPRFDEAVLPSSCQCCVDESAAESHAKKNGQFLGRPQRLIKHMRQE